MYFCWPSILPGDFGKKRKVGSPHTPAEGWPPSALPLAFLSFQPDLMLYDTLLGGIGGSTSMSSEEHSMYIYYILRGTQVGKPVELEGEIDEEHFPGVDLNNGPAIIDYLVPKISSETGTDGDWQECDLTDSFFNREDSYIYFNGRWMRRSDAPWRKDRDN